MNPPPRKEHPMNTTTTPPRPDARTAKRRQVRAAHAAAPSAWARQAATRKATRVPVAGRDVDPRDLVATLVHGVAAQQLTAEQLVDVLHTLRWEVPRERILALVTDALDRLY